MMTDPIADLLTRIRNATRILEKKVDVPYSKMKERIVAILKKEGYVVDYHVLETVPAKTIRIHVKYSDNDDVVIRYIQRVSRPGCRVYKRVNEIPKVQNGMGIGIYSTPKGVLTDHDCRKERVGGEYLLSVW
ncbi:MAG: 30S ribosomal protein S8 [Planctomycetes bacterium]|nr:30S ribosomal protein S8 [Planctomycetota bacterium]